MTIYMVKLRFFLVLVLLVAFGVPAFAGGVWSEPAVVTHRATPVLTYRARLEGKFLVVEVTHAEGWHSYSMDNIERARKRSGETKPETELPTKIVVSGELNQVGKWFQSEPVDLSQEGIYWYTWGFAGTAYFATRVEQVSGDTANIKISGQACNESSCSMIKDLVVTVPLGQDAKTDEERVFKRARLVEVKTD